MMITTGQATSRHEENDVNVLILGRSIYALFLIRILGGFPNDHNGSGSKSVRSRSSSQQFVITLGTSVGYTDIGSFSRYVDNILVMPRADVDLEAYYRKICDFVRDKTKCGSKIVIVPVLEEAIFLAKITPQILKEHPNTKILVSSAYAYQQLHDKFKFQECMANIFDDHTYKVAIPRSTVVKNQEQMEHAVSDFFEKNQHMPKIVLKALFSRGSVGTYILNREDRIPSDLFAHQSSLYVVQEFAEGKEFSTLSFCINGVVISHVGYLPQGVNMDGVSCIRTLLSPSPSSPTKWSRSLQFVQRVAKKLNLTGHFGFDFIEQFNGSLVPLECNPRLTNGIAFFLPRFYCRNNNKYEQNHHVSERLRQVILDWINSDCISNVTMKDVIYPELCCCPRNIMTNLTTVSYMLKSDNPMPFMELAITAYDDMFWLSDPLPFLLLLLRILLMLINACLIFLFSNSSSRSVIDIFKQMVIDEMVTYQEKHEFSQSRETASIGGLLQPEKDAPRKSHTSTSSGSKNNKKKILVTGATDLLGGRLVQILHTRHFQIHQQNNDKTDNTMNSIQIPSSILNVLHSIEQITAIGKSEERGKKLVESLNTNEEGAPKVKFIQADLSDAYRTHKLIQGHDIVFHCSEISEPWGCWEDYLNANVASTENIVHSCHLLKDTVKLLVHISTSSVYSAVDTSRPSFDINEMAPLPADDKQPNRYSVSKKMAESIIMNVSQRYNDQHSMQNRGEHKENHFPRCIILRPREMFGPSDNNNSTIFSLLVDRLRKGQLLVIENQDCIFDCTYVDNVVYACLCCLTAEDKSEDNNMKTTVMTKIYNITNDEPQLLWPDIISKMCTKLKLANPSTKWIVPRLIAYHGAHLLEVIAVARLLLFGSRTEQPLFTREVVNNLSISATFDIQAAKQELGYKPIVTVSQGLDNFLDSYMENGKND